jgi:RNA polymerase sigma factor (sigma-70 family)
MADRQSALILRHLRKIVPDPQADRQSDRQLLQQFLATQDEAAFAVLVRRHGAMVLAVCQSILHHEQDAQDASQATFLVLARKAGSIRKQESVGSWLHGVAYRLALKARQGNRRRRGDRGSRKEEPNRGGHGVTRRLFLPASARTPRLLDELTWRELREVLHQELSRLPDKNRLPLILCYLEGLTQEEAARQLGLTPATVKGRLDRGRQLLRARLTRRGLTFSVPLLAAALSRDVARASSPTWLKATVQAAVQFARGESATVLSSQSAAWAQAALKTMGMSKLKIVATLITALGILSAGTGLAVHQLAPGEQGNKTDAKAKPAQERRQQESAPARRDQLDEPLPPEALARFGSTRLKHAGFIFSLAFTPDGKTLVSQGTDCLRTWDVATGRQIRQFPEQSANWTGASLSADGKQVATGQGGAIHLWDVSTGQSLASFGSGVNSDRRVCFSRDGRLLASAAHPALSQIEIWDARTREQLHFWRTDGNTSVTAMTFTNDGKALITALTDHTVRCWDVDSMKLLWGVSLAPSKPVNMVLSPKGDLLAILCKKPGPPRERPEDQIRIIDLTAGAKQLRQLTARGNPNASDPAGNFTAMAFSPDGKSLFATHDNGTLAAWNPTTGQYLRRYAAGFAQVNELAVSPNGNLVAACIGLNTVRVFDLRTSKDLFGNHGHQRELFQVGLACDGSLAFSNAREGAIIVWDAASGRERHRLPGYAAAVSADGRTLVTQDADNTLRFWDFVSGKELHSVTVEGKPFFGHALSADGKSLAVRGHDPTIRLHDAVTGKQRFSWSVDEGASGLAFAADGQRLIAWSMTHSAYVFDLDTGRELRQFALDPPLKVPVDVGPQGAKIGFRYEAQVSNDGKWIVYARGNFLNILDTTNGQVARRLPDLGAKAGALAFSPDAKTLAWAAVQSPAIHLVELATGKERHRFISQGGRVLALAFSPDGRRLICGKQDTTALVWDVTGRLAAGDSWNKPLLQKDLQANVLDLGHEDAARAYQAIRRLAASPSEAIPYWRNHLNAVPAVDDQRLARLIADLDNRQFTVRESATRELENLGELAVPACRKALEQKPSAEARRRLEALLERQRQEALNPSTKRLRTLRAIEALEHIGNQEAQQVLKTLAQGAPEARLTQEAKASLARLAKRPASR